MLILLSLNVERFSPLATLFLCLSVCQSLCLPLFHLCITAQCVSVVCGFWEYEMHIVNVVVYDGKLLGMCAFLISKVELKCKKRI